jgi:hypothetical protein
MLVSITTPGSRPARWTRWRRAAEPVGLGLLSLLSLGRVSGSRSAMASAVGAAVAARIQAAANPERSIATSPNSGPMPIPT